MLPPIEQKTPERNNFPTRWQTVIFRNYRMVSNKNIAAVLGCSEADVEREALRMGLCKGDCDPDWLERGYITVIRNNWYTLPYDQLMTLTGMPEDKFDFAINQEDFLWVKLGRTKPECEPVSYAPLTDKDIAQTEKIAKLVRDFDTSKRKAFDFFTDTADCPPKYVANSDNGTRIVHGFLTTCGDAFIEDSRKQMPDVLLDCYARQSVNVLFVHGVLSTLSPYRFDPELSRDYKIRRENLQSLIDRAALRGIKIYLYFNEPRALPPDVFERYGKPEIGGGTHTNGHRMLCLSTEEPREYLYSATKDLFENVKGIGGIFTITRSENPTNCHFLSTVNCPRCKDIPKYELPVLVNNIMHKAIRDAGSDAEVIAYAWGWPSYFNEEELNTAFATLHPEIGVMQVSENLLPINKGGIPCEVRDYSISNPGPSPVANYVLSTAAKYGHKLYAKVQMCNSWEFSAVPYLPVFDTELKHLENLHEIGVNNYMLTWTLGGYPAITYDLVSDYMIDPDSFNIDDWYKKQFGDRAENIHAAIKKFCEGFDELPFSIDLLYRSPKNMGPANMWSLTKDERVSTMVCYSFDDYEYWTRPYPIDIHLSQMNKLIALWKEGCDMLEKEVYDEKTEELLLFARFATLQYVADTIHTRYAVCKRNLPESRDEMRAIFKEEREITKQLLELMEKSTLIGFETSNHYFFTERNYIEKLVQLEELEAELDNM